MRRDWGLRALSGALLIASLAGAPAHAEMIGNMDGSAEFPQGAISFADAVVSYTPGSVTLDPRVKNPAHALGLPDMQPAAAQACVLTSVDCPFVSLGTGGSLILRFVDNVLTGSGDASPDLFIFETGPIVQGTLVAVSGDGASWSSVGAIGGGVRGIDLDAFGFGPASLFRYVRLIDDGIIDPAQGEDGESLLTLGADIDAVGAISTAAVVPLPAAAWLLVSGLGLLALPRRRGRAARA